MNNFCSPGKGERVCFSTDISHTQHTDLPRIPDDALGIQPGASVSLQQSQSRTSRPFPPIESQSCRIPLGPGGEGPGDALTPARYQLQRHVADTESNTSCKSYSRPSETSRSLCSQARALEKGKIPPNHPKTSEKPSSSTETRKQQLRLANPLSRDQQTRLSPPVPEITACLTNICLFASVL